MVIEVDQPDLVERLIEKRVDIEFLGKYERNILQSLNRLLFAQKNGEEAEGEDPWVTEVENIIMNLSMMDYLYRSQLLKKCKLHMFYTCAKWRSLRGLCKLTLDAIMRSRDEPGRTKVIAEKDRKQDEFTTLLLEIKKIQAQAQPMPYEVPEPRERGFWIQRFNPKRAREMLRRE